jgi:DNA-directed RNA polymerase specialized sigma24 family protein
LFDTSPEEILALDEALLRLEEEDPDGHRLVQLRYYTGLTVPEAARIMGASVRTLERKWRFLRAWLASQLEAPATG